MNELLLKTAVIDICGEMKTGINARNVANNLNSSLPRSERGIDWHKISNILNKLKNDGFLAITMVNEDGTWYRVK